MQESISMNTNTIDSFPAHLISVDVDAVNIGVSVDVKPESPLKKYVQEISVNKRPHGHLILEGICSHCAHCSQKLTDAVSIERGIGPVCAKRGYLEDPSEGSDEMEAFIHLSKWPEVAQFLLDKYEENKARGVMNGLVRIASLNDDIELHASCCDAIQSLGWHKLANTLRESLAIMTLKEIEFNGEKVYAIWIRKDHWCRAWFNELRNIPGFGFSATERKPTIPVTQKLELFKWMIAHYSGKCARVVGKHAFKIEPKITR